MQLNQIEDLLIEATSYCNASCPMCPRVLDNGQINPTMPIAHLTLATITKSIDKTKLTNLKRIIFEGDHGDAVMNPDLLSIIKFFDFVPEIVIVTNGSIQTTKWWTKLGQLPNVTVIWSIDGLADTNHLYRVGVDFDKIVNNATAYINAGGTAIWKCILFKHNQHQIIDLFKYSKQLNFKAIKFEYPLEERFTIQDSPITKYPVYILNNYSYSIELPDIKVPGLLLHDRSYKLRYGLLDINNIDLKCKWANKGRIYISFLGEVVPCCMVSGKLGTNFKRQGETNQKFFTIASDTTTSLSLHYHSLEEILLSKFYSSELEQSLNDTTTMLPECAQYCF